MDVLFDYKTKKYILIGEDHIGKYGFDFNNSEHVDFLKTFLSNKMNASVYYEGPNITAMSRSYKNFVSELNTWVKKTDIKCNFFQKGWETDLIIPKNVEYSAVLLGAEPSQVASLIGSLLDGKRSLLDAIVDCRRFKGSQKSSPTKQDIIYALTEHGKPSEVLAEMSAQNSANMDVINKIYGGQVPLRDAYYEGNSNTKKSSEIYKRVDSFNSFRDKHLANKMKTTGGIFLAGNDHIPLVKKYL